MAHLYSQLPNLGGGRMSLTLVNLFTVPPGEEDAFEARFKAVCEQLDGMPGFEGTELHRNAAFVAPETVLPPSPPAAPATEAVRMIAPPSGMTGMACCIRKNAPFTLT